VKLVKTHIAKARKKTKSKSKQGCPTNVAWGKIVSGRLTQVQTYDLHLPI